MMRALNTINQAIFFPRVILYNFFLIFSFIMVWGFGVRVLVWVLGLDFPVDGVCGLWCGAFWGLWVGALYINIKD